MDQRIIRFELAAARRMRDHLARAYPEEGCGILVGRGRAGRLIVDRAEPAENVSEGPRGQRYRIAPERLLQVWKAARDDGREILGFYHSHPGRDAEPSARDLREGAPTYAYVIVPVGGEGPGPARAFRIAEDGGRFEELGIETAGA